MKSKPELMQTDADQVFADICDELGCAYDNEAALSAISDLKRARELISRPYIGAWSDEVIAEAAHQRDRWGSDQDHGKQSEDWFWLVGYLAGKALASHKLGDLEKARHHTVSTGAVLAHWAAAINGDESVFRPGLGIEKIAAVGIATQQKEAKA